MLPLPNAQSVHGLLSAALESSEEDQGSKSSPVVGSVVVTLEAREKLVIGAFINTGDGLEWEYWEGEFGPSELEEHVRTWVWCTQYLVFSTWTVEAFAENQVYRSIRSGLRATAVDVVLRV